MGKKTKTSASLLDDILEDLLKYGKSSEKQDVELTYSDGVFDMCNAVKKHLKQPKEKNGDQI